MIITNSDHSFEDIFDLGGDEFSEAIIEDGVENLLDSRLDADSVLIEDIKLETENGNFTINDLKTHNIKVESDEEASSNSLSPLQRDRCNTWPRILLERSPNGNVESWQSPPQLACVSEEAETMAGDLGVVTRSVETVESFDTMESGESAGSGSVYGRRNPWGNQSYADLITQAISSSPERRMTLSQIYDWMVAHIPYFGDRQSSSKSAGWKNSIRHNLSLHQKFVKVPNEGAGKSSWWTLNLESGQTRKPRRRATSGDVRVMSAKRERVRARTESFKAPEKLSRSYSSSGMSQQAHKQLHPSSSLPSPGYDTLTSLPSMSCGSLSGPFSSFRSRNLSTTSTTSQDSCGFNMEDLVSSELCNYWHQEESNTQVPLEIGNFSINSNSVDMEQEEFPHILQPMQTIHPLQPLHHNDLDMGIQKRKLKILEPRESPLTNVPVTQYPMYQHQEVSHTQEMLDTTLTPEQKMSPRSDLSMTLSELTESSSLSPETEFATSMKIYDEERRQMIVQQLEILNERKMTEHADVDNSIMLLQEQLDLMVRRSSESNVEERPIL